MAESKNAAIVVKEGYKHILLAFVPFALSVYADFGGFLQLLFFILFVFTIFFFRNTERVVADDSVGSILSPVDGIIESIERLEDGSGVTVRIANGMFDTHVVRAPFKTMIKKISFRHGMAIAGDFEKANRLNMHCEVQFEGVTMRIVASFFPYAMSCYSAEGEEIRHGEQIGYFYTGDVELLLPKNINLHINIGDRVKSAENLIGIIKES